MEAEDLVLDHSRQGQVVKKLCELLPDVGVSILAQAFVIETVYLSDLARLVVASENSDSVLEADFEGDKQGDSLDTVVAAIDVIAHEKVVCVGRLATDLEKFAEIMELAVDVTANSDRRANLLHVRLVYQDFLGLVAKYFNLTLRERFTAKKHFNLLVK